MQALSDELACWLLEYAVTSSIGARSGPMESPGGAAEQFQDVRMMSPPVGGASANERYDDDD